MFNHILLPTDGTPASLKAAHVAIELAARCGSHLSVLHVVEPIASPRHRGGVAVAVELDRIADLQRLSDGYLRQIQELAEVRGAVCTTSQVTCHAPSEAVEEFAELHDCDLIVMGSHGKHGLKRLVLGSQTQKVLMVTTRPVLICP